MSGAAGAAYDPGMTRLIALSFVAVGALAFAAPSFAASPSEWAKSADKICARANAELDKIPQPTTVALLIRASEKFQEVGKRQADDLAKLKRPSGDAAAIGKVVDSYEQQVGLVKGLIAALKKNDQKKVKALVTQGDALAVVAAKIVKGLGAANCSR